MAGSTFYRPIHQLEKARLVFNAQLHQQLKNIGKNREISTVPGAPTISNNGSMRPTQPMMLNGAGRSTDLNGWSLERKMLSLVEMLELLQCPFFFYLDFGTAAAAEALNGGSAGTTSDRKLTYHSYFNKILPLHVGQTVLLDLWDYLMDMVDHVPVRNHCRALYLQAAVYICRRVEFIEGYPLDGQQVHMDSLVSKRYIQLLERSIRYSSVKLRKARSMAEEHRFFVAHMYAAVYFRFPFATPKLMEAVLQCTDRLEGGKDSGTTSNGRSEEQNESRKSSARPPKRRYHGNATGCLRSPRHCPRNWNDLSDTTCRSDRISGVDLQLAIFSSFLAYKANRGTDRLVVPVKGGSTPGIPQDMLKKGPSPKSIAAALEAIFQYNMNRVGEEQEVTFLYQLPLLYIGHKLQNDAFVKLAVTSQDKIDAGLDIFVERMKSPGRDDLLAVNFVAAVLSDVSCWCSHRHAGRILWHCVPGYFVLVRLYVAVFKRMCQRRARSNMNTSSLPSVHRILSIIEGKTSDPWEDYWNGREIDTVLDAGKEILKNEMLVNVLMQIILESTNILDPTSVNYSFGILQRTFEIASMAATPSTASESGSSTGKVGGRVRHCLGTVFDGDYFLQSMRSALQSSHVQIVLKVLTSIYNCIDLLPTTARKRLVAELILRDNFFHFFLHWNEEIRKIFCYMIVFKTSASNRLDLPSASDRILLAQTPFFEAGTSTGSSLSAASPALSYLSHLSELAQAMLRPSAESEMDPAKKAAVGRKALQRLVNWDSSARLKRIRSSGDAVFRDSLGDEELSVDLSIASKLDANFKMIAEQMDREKPEEAPLKKRYFPRELEAYAERALSQYVLVLWEYYEAAFENPVKMPIAPSLEFTISVPFFSD